jgi:dihydrofolate reductase
MSMSLDGFVTGPHDSRKNPLGEGGEVLHHWLGPTATAAQQALAVGLLDEIQVHLVPVLLGGGVRLFDLLGGAPVELHRERVVEAGSGVTHLRYGVKK